MSTRDGCRRDGCLVGSAVAFENAYGGTPTWEIGRPQAALVRLVERGCIAGDVLDVGCGTGENALYLASLGHDVTGIDFSPAAIGKAEAKARDLGVRATFRVHDARELRRLTRTFDTAIDIGLLHSLQPDDWPAYASGLATVVRPNGRCFILCWSDRNSFGRGPERVSRRAIRNTFRDAWWIEAIEPEALETLLPEGRVHAWLVELARR